MDYQPRRRRRFIAAPHTRRRRALAASRRWEKARSARLRRMCLRGSRRLTLARGRNALAQSQKPVLVLPASEVAIAAKPLADHILGEERALALETVLPTDLWSVSTNGSRRCPLSYSHRLGSMIPSSLSLLQYGTASALAGGAPMCRRLR